MQKSEIRSILLVGGSSHFPAVKDILQQLFPGIEIQQDSQPDLVVAKGAALLAGLLADGRDIADLQFDYEE